MATSVSVDNFVRAETSRMFDGLLSRTGGVNRWWHLRAPATLDAQAVIRMNRDTLYSAAIVDIGGGGATLTVPDAGDVAAVNALQDALRIDAARARPYGYPDYDRVSLDATRQALLTLAEGVADTRRMFGARSAVDPVRHLLGTAFGWGGMPESEAFYFIESEPRPVGHHRIVIGDVPVDAFWSFTVYNRDGFFEENPYAAYSLNSVTARLDADGTVTIDLAPTDEGYRNHLFVMDGWNYTMRLYRPRAEILDGTWVAARPHPVA